MSSESSGVFVLEVFYHMVGCRELNISLVNGFWVFIWLSFVFLSLDLTFHILYLCICKVILSDSFFVISKTLLIVLEPILSNLEAFFKRYLCFLFQLDLVNVNRLLCLAWANDLMQHLNHKLDRCFLVLLLDYLKYCTQLLFRRRFKLCLGFIITGRFHHVSLIKRGQAHQLLLRTDWLSIKWLIWPNFLFLSLEILFVLHWSLRKFIF